MSELTDGLDKLIQKAALDGALTPDAVAQFHSLVKQCDAQAEEIADLQKVNENITTNRDELSRKLKIMLDDANELSTRAAAVHEAEQEHANREVKLECAELRVKDHQEMFRVVFRNAVIKRDVVTPGNSSFDQYNNKTDNFPDKTPVEEEQT